MVGILFQFNISIFGNMLSTIYKTILIFVLFERNVELTRTGPCLVKSAHWEGKELQMVHLLVRHAARTPNWTYKNDPYQNYTFYPYGWRQLTNKGKHNIYHTGKWLSKRYGKFLGSYYQPDIIWAQSTQFTRTMMSLQLLLAGLFRPKGTPMDWNSDLNWQPIPVFANPKNNDPLLEGTPCPRYKQLFNESLLTPQYQKKLQNNQTLYNEITRLTGKLINIPAGVQMLYSNLIAVSKYGLKLPNWTHGIYPDRLIPLTKESFMEYVPTTEMKLLKGGPFIKRMIENWNQKINGTISPKNRKMFMYCAHDDNLAAILSTINVWKPQIPDYGFMAMFELLKDIKTGEFGVVIYTKRNVNHNPITVNIPGCDTFCPIDKFIELTKNIIPKNWKLACELKNTN